MAAHTEWSSTSSQWSNYSEQEPPEKRRSDECENSHVSCEGLEGRGSSIGSSRRSGVEDTPPSAHASGSDFLTDHPRGGAEHRAAGSHTPHRRSRAEELSNTSLLRSACRRAGCLLSPVRGLVRARDRTPQSGGWRRVLVLMVGLALLQHGGAQQMCPAPSQLVCGRCPNQCRQCVAQDHNIKCPGASWGNTNSTFMNISCGVPPGVAPERFPSIPVLEPTYTAPLACSGTVQKGLWPFDADNMTFTLETMFR